MTRLKHTRLFTFCCCLLSLLASKPGWASCEVDLYVLFKQYRLHLNNAERLEDLSGYFSNRFNEYYIKRIQHGKDRKRYIDQYWRNLNTAADLLITYNQQQRCLKDTSRLSITGLLRLDQQRPGETLDLWRLDVKYILQDSQWKIDAFEYNLVPTRLGQESEKILDNFTVIKSP